MKTPLTHLMIADKMERCHKAAKALLGENWQDNVDSWRRLIDAYRKANPGTSILEAAIFIADTIQGADYSMMVLMGVAFELISKEKTNDAQIKDMGRDN